MIIVANSLPLQVTQQGKVAYNETMIANIVPGVQNLKKAGAIQDFLFIGHCPITTEDVKYEQELKDLACVPVDIPSDVYESYYSGFCKTSLWPLLHYRVHLVEHSTQSFEGYQQVNKLFADTIISVCKPGDVIWIHDYHLMLLPSLLREKIPRGVPIGFFFHVPFPSSELFRVLPNRSDLLLGVLGADLIGFQNFEYVRHFEGTVSRLLGAESLARGIESPVFGGHFVRVDVFNGGIDFSTFDSIMNQPANMKKLDNLREIFKGKKVIISRDRVDEIEGVPLKLHAIEKFFNKYPEWKGNLIHFQIYESDDEEEMEDAKQLLREVNQIVGRLNGAFGKVDYVPIEYVHKNLPLDEICVLYAIANVSLVTPVRAGLDFVPNEYVSCQNAENPGVLILSEFAGAARCFSGARLVNPFDTNDFVEALNESLCLPEEDRIAMHQKNVKYVKANTSGGWCKSFFDELNASVTHLITHSSVPMLDIDEVTSAYSSSKKDRIFLLDYDGTLSPMTRHPKLAAPSGRVIEVLTKLAKSPHNKVYVISGRDKDSLDHWLGHLNVGLACEHGTLFKPIGAKEWQIMTKEETPWRQAVISLMEDFADRTPGTFVELKQTNLTWHYRGSDPEFGNVQARELVLELQTVANKYPVDIMREKKAIEVKPQSVSKGNIVQHIIEQNPNFDFVFCIGDDRTDEDMFAKFCDSTSTTHFTTCVMADAKRTTQAKYWVESYNDVLDVLSSLVDVDEKLAITTNNTKQNSLFPPVRHLRRNSLLSLGASARDKKRFSPSKEVDVGSCGIIQRAQHLQE